MKFQSTALVLALGISATSAFTPATRAFSTRSALNVQVQDEELFKGLDRNGALASDIADRMSVSGSTKPKPVLDADLLKKTNADIKSFMRKYEGISGAAIVYKSLLDHGVEVVNGYSGGAVLPLLDQFHPDNPRHEELGKEPIRWITNSNESSSGHIAEGYAKSYPIDREHKPVGVVIATSGPGVTNLITPLQDGMCDGVPMIVLCGQAATSAPEDAFQSAPAVEITTPCTKWSYQIKSAAELPNQNGLTWQYQSSSRLRAITGEWKDDNAIVCEGNNKV